MQPASGEVRASPAGAACAWGEGRERQVGSNLRVLRDETQNTWFSATAAFQTLSREPTERARDFVWGARSAGSPSALGAKL